MNIENMPTLGRPQTCPMCQMSNPSGYLLPDNCQYCKGTGKVEIFTKENQMEKKEPKLMWSESVNKHMTWEEAIKYANDLREGGYDDWRLPTIEELVSLIDYTKFGPACNDTRMNSARYWSCTTYAGNTSYAWSVFFNFGSVYYQYKANNGYVRCVRNG